MTTHDIFAQFMVRASTERSSVIVGVGTAAEAAHRINQMRSEGLTNIMVHDRKGHTVGLDELIRLADLEASQSSSAPH